MIPTPETDTSGRTCTSTSGSTPTTSARHWTPQASHRPASSWKGPRHRRWPSAAEARRTLTALADLGVGLGLDDFGTGFSSLTHVNTLPFDILKIERSFMTAASTGDKRALATVAAVCALGHGFELDVVAQGIEDRTFLPTLTNHGCRYAQGFALAPPLASGQVTAALATHGQRGWNLDGTPVTTG